MAISSPWPMARTIISSSGVSRGFSPRSMQSPGSMKSAQTFAARPVEKANFGKLYPDADGGVRGDIKTLVHLHHCLRVAETARDDRLVAGEFAGEDGAAELAGLRRNDGRVLGAKAQDGIAAGPLAVNGHAALRSVEQAVGDFAWNHVHRRRADESGNEEIGRIVVDF